MKQRLDILLAQRGLVASREAAKRHIMAGEVYVNGQKCDKAGESVSQEANIELRSTGERYVSRGGYKLEKAIQSFPITLAGRVCMDIGASTGGFTDCMLQNGASRVYAVDVGYGQLAWKLRENAQVINLERTNIRYITKDQVPEQIDFISIDVSFISLTLVLPVAWGLLHDGGTLIALIKPQFEAGREHVGRKGVVRDQNVHIQVIQKIILFAAQQGFSIGGLEYSPIKGPQGNIEYLIWLNKNEKMPPFDLPAENAVAALVKRSHEELDRKN